MDGFGTLKAANGDVYSGNWKASEKNGFGTYRWADGRVYEGKFKAG